MRHRRTLAIALVGALAPALPAVAGAQSCAIPTAATIAAGETAALAPRALGGRATRAWPAPLDREVDAPARAEPRTLQAALEQLTIASHVRFSYSPELLPLGRLTCVPAGRRPLGEALRVVLAGTGVVPVVAGRDQVVLAPERTSANVEQAPELARTLGRLDRVVVTGTATGGTERASPFALNVIEGAALERAGTRTVAQLLDGTVPGLWMWTQSPSSLTARYGSVRGASSFAATSPKVYVDGIELANPLLLSQLDASRIARIEVIRGPQGAALYGADAISGVINVVTKQEGATVGARAELRAGAGTAATAYAPEAALTQEHALTLRAGSAARSASLATTMTTMGDYLPGASARQLAITAGTRHVGARVSISGTARYQDAAAAAVASPLVDSLASPFVSGDAQRLRQYTLGANAVVQASERWTHAFVAGIDGYHQRGLASESLPVGSVADSIGARGNAQRLTLRASATRRMTSDSARVASSITLGAEQSLSRTHGDSSGVVGMSPQADGPGVCRGSGETQWWCGTGLFAQGQASWRNALFVQGGARAEFITGLSKATQFAILPMLGAAWVHERGTTSLKLRGAYGRGIRPARVGPSPHFLTVDPESQSGLEWGADLRVEVPGGAHVALQATRFDQLASDLVQAMRWIDSSCYRPPGGSGGRVLGGQQCSAAQRAPRYMVETIGQIENDGWEMQASVARGPLTLSSSMALVDSRVQKLAMTYRGDLLVGDRMLEVPARTFGLAATWTAPRWTLGVNAARASEWRNYDRAALAAANVAAAADTTRSTLPPVGAALRPFVRDYEGVTRLGTWLDLTLWRATALTLRGDNLLGRQVGEPDNVTVLPGRTVIVGIRTAF